MKRWVTLLLLTIIMITSRTSGQSVNVGLRLESYAYSISYPQKHSSSVVMMPIPLFSGYIKAGILFSEKYEFELKAGVQIIDPFYGPEYAISFKYGLTKKIFPLITYMKHSNGGNSHTGGGTYSYTLDFIGFGAEAKLKKVFALDLVYYIPVGRTDLEYELDYLNGGIIKTSKMGSMIKLGFIFSFYL